MTPERWQQINQLFHAALARDAEGRAAFLTAACAGDEELRRQVEAMLTADDGADDLLDRPAYAAVPELFSLPDNQSELQTGLLAESLVGRRIGFYQLARELGRGGMGEVYLAHDARLGRDVALKLLPARFTQDAERVRRFQREARAASALNHPNILTIFDIGQEGGRNYIAAEFVEGQTLRALIGDPSLTINQTLDVVVQIVAALSAAHRAGIIHRDIKPENVMLRPDGYVKVLDFGLAKLTERNSPASSGEDAGTKASEAESVFETKSGMVMGTINYMSPEQAKGQKVDERTDIFGLGVVLYELATGHHPFARNSRAETIVALLEHEPPPLAQYRPGLPPELQWIVTRALAKRRAQRYTTGELQTDLKRLKQLLDAAEVSGGDSGNARFAALASSKHGNARITAGGAITTLADQTLSGLPKGRKLAAGLAALAAVILIAIALFAMANWFGSGSAKRAPLTERDTILLADFDNRTGELVFDGTLKQALAVQLGQTPFLNLFSDERVRETLRLMGRAPESQVTREVGREICQRQGLKALLAGSIASLGSNYVITLEAINGQSGESLATQQTEAESKEQVLRALGQAAAQLRAKLGESLSSMQQFNTPLEQATTSSLEALKAFSLGAAKGTRGNFTEAIPLYKRAVELDSEFAMAYKELASQYNNARQIQLTAEAAEKAFALRERVTEREKFHIESIYYLHATAEYDRAIESLVLLKQTYPRDDLARNTIAYCYNLTGQPEKVLAEAREAIRLNPNYASPRSNLAAALVGLNRFDEAKATLEQMSQEKLDTPAGHCGLYVIASAQSDAATARRELDWLEQNSYEYFAHYMQAWTTAKAGRLRQSEDFGRQAVEQARQRNLKDLAASFAATEMLIKAGCGLCRQSRQEATAALALSRAGLGRAAVPALPGVAFALALCGEVTEAQKLADELARRYPKATMVNAVFLPLIHAAIELHRGNADRAVQLLEAATRYESAVGWWPTYVRGQAYLRLNQGGAAAAEFQKILDHPGWGPYPYSIFYAPAHLGLARAAALNGDQAQARKAYQDFFAAWKDADADLPILLEARKEYEKVK